MLIVLTQPAPTVEQSTVGGEQVVVQELAEHRVPPPQTLPQVPQLLLSLAVLTQVPEHDTWPVGHLQSPATQNCPPEHARPHAPQLLLSADRLVSQPLALLRSQLP